MWKKFKENIKGISLRWDKGFVRNLIVVIGVVFVWRGMWNLIDEYFFPEMSYAWNNIISILLGILILYLPDSSVHELGENELFENKRRK
ncbi:hypothetical protein K9M41_03415 [Candidatus Gracilibacteria bacterium]|nr:hypothetical protein [Candidatus Gracilibacteria bacterium]